MNELSKALEYKNQLDLLRPIKKEDELRIMQKFRLDWNYHSNNIEGNSLTEGETKALILFGITAQGKPLKDHFEVTGHDNAVKWILDIVKEERPLNENFIRELHKLILKEPYEVDAITEDGNPTKKKINIGEYKKTPNHVKTKTGEIFRFATPEETPILMEELIEWYRSKEADKTTNHIILAADFHYKFIRIHPFDDSNGRTARIIMNFILLKYGYPPVVIKTYDKANYFSALQLADTGNIEPFFEYIAKNLNESLAIMLKGAKGESVEEEDDIDKEVALLERKLKNLRNPINESRSLESKLSSFETLVKPLIKKFIEKCSLFDKFYVRNNVTTGSGKHRLTFDKHLIIDRSKMFISEENNDLYYDYHYEGFNQAGFKDSNFTSGIYISFNLTSVVFKSPYIINKYEKLYGEEFSDQEITDIVAIEVKRHKNTIEQLIEKKK